MLILPVNFQGRQKRDTQASDSSNASSLSSENARLPGNPGSTAASAGPAGAFAGRNQAGQIDRGCLWEFARLAAESRYVCSCENSILSLTAFARRRSRRAPQQRDLADRSHIKDTNPIPGIDNRRALLLRQKDLFGVFHGNRLAVHSNLERTERARLQSGFQVGEFHRGKSKPGRSEGKSVRRIEKTVRMAHPNMRTHFADTNCDQATVARSGLPRSADFSPLPSGSPEIAGSGLKSALRPEISSQSAAQASLPAGSGAVPASRDVPSVFNSDPRLKTGGSKSSSSSFSSSSSTAPFPMTRTRTTTRTRDSRGLRWFGQIPIEHNSATMGR